jgi:hypothetical protein
VKKITLVERRKVVERDPASWMKGKHPHLLHLPSKYKIGALASPPRSLATTLITMVKTALL